MTTKAKTDGKTKELCHYDSLTRTRFFRGMLLTEEHLSAEQTYHREALKRVNRHLYGPGIVCGLEVDHTTGLCITVQPGLALDCHGNAIDVCKPITLDLSDACRQAYPPGCPPQDVKPIKRHLVLRYVEIQADPEPVLTPSDDCTPADPNAKCQASKYREGFCLEIREHCPDTDPCEEKDLAGYSGVLATVSMLAGSSGTDVVERLRRIRPKCVKSPPCQDCACDDAAVGLATLELDCAKNMVSVVACQCRQYVWSPRFLRWLACEIFRGADKDRGIADATRLRGNLPSASVLARNPLQAVWDIAEVALGSRVGPAPTGYDTTEGQPAYEGRPRRSRARPRDQRSG